MGSRVRIRLFHILHFVMDFLFPLLKNSGVDDRGHRLRSGSPVTNLPGAASLLQNILQSDKLISTQAELPFASSKWFWLISLQKDHWWIFPFISKLITRWHSFGLLYNNSVGDSPIIRWCGYFIRSAAIRIKIFLLVDFLCCWILWDFRLPFTNWLCPSPWHLSDQAFGLSSSCSANHLVFVGIINLTQKQISVGLVGISWLWICFRWGLVNNSTRKIFMDGV